MNALQHNRYTESWTNFGASLERPKAVLVISAHWYVNITAVTAMRVPRTIHDFYGFPSELFSVEYPAPGDPSIAERIVDVVRPTYVGLDEDSWGIDHGTWSYSCTCSRGGRAGPATLDQRRTAFRLPLQSGGPIARAAQRRVLIVGSGNVVHNLRLVDFNSPASAPTGPIDSTTTCARS